MEGSKPIVSYSLNKTVAQTKLIKNLINALNTQGWTWFTDYYVEWGMDTIILQLYQEELMPIVKEYIVEETI